MNKYLFLILLMLTIGNGDWTPIQPLVTIENDVIVVPGRRSVPDQAGEFVERRYLHRA